MYCFFIFDFPLFFDFMDSISIRERSTIMDINKNGFLFLGTKMKNSSKYK